MDPDEERRQSLAPPSVRDHLANERTLLSWIRTALTVIALGFLVDRLAVSEGVNGWQSVVGIGLVLIGGLVAIAGAYSYLNARRELASGTYRPQVWLHLSIVALVVIGALLIAIYLVTTP
jgi:putative membrane protein